jgi:sulfur relay (sulfurtransferase) DsrF/TusC family protein
MHGTQRSGRKTVTFRIGCRRHIRFVRYDSEFRCRSKFFQEIRIMPEKKVLIIVKSKPYSQINYYEALRVAVGLWEHKVNIIWMNDGVYAVLKDADMSLTEKFFKEFEDLEINLYVEKKALKKRGFEKEDILFNAEVIDNKRISELISEAQTSLVF